MANMVPSDSTEDIEVNVPGVRGDSGLAHPSGRG